MLRVDKTPSKKSQKSSTTETKIKSDTAVENVPTEEEIVGQYNKEDSEDTDTDVMEAKDEVQDDVPEEEVEKNSPSPPPEVGKNTKQ